MFENKWKNVAAMVIIAALISVGVSWALYDVAVVQGTTNFDTIKLSQDLTVGDDLTVTDDAAVGGDMTVSGTTSWGCNDTTINGDLTITGTMTAEDGVITDTLDVNGDVDLDGDGFDVNITAGFSIDGDAASNVNVAGAGVDFTIESEAGRVVVKGDEAAANAIHLDANDAVTTGIDIDVGSVSGLTIDGGLVDIGGGTCGVADGDNDVCIKGVLEVDDEFELDGALDADSTSDFADTATFSKASGNAIVVTSGGDLDMNGKIALDGHADEVQFAVTGYTTQTNDLVQFGGGLTDIGGGSYDTADGDNDLGIAGDLEVDGELELDGALDADSTANIQGAVTLQSTLDVAGITTLAGEVENFLAPSLTSASYTFTVGAGGTATLATIADGEVWLILGCYANVTTNWDVTAGDDATFDVGDGGDVDGLLDLDDAELQAADTEGTGAVAGWQGFMSTEARGAYMAQTPFLYAPSGADETIDVAWGATGDDLTAGEITVYLLYVRIK